MPEPEIILVDRLDCRVAQRPWPFVTERANDIDAHWAKLTAARPAIYNGQVLLQHTARIVAEHGQQVFAAQYLQTDFKSFVAWRDFGKPEAGVRNAFAMAALRSADGAFIVGEMSAHTANAGRCYFPAGTPDPGDVRDGILDLDGSARRELQEETGIDPADLRFASVWNLVMDGGSIACMKPVRSPQSAATIASGVEAFLRTEAQPELARIHLVRTMSDTEGLDMPSFMRPYLAWALARPQPAG